MLEFLLFLEGHPALVIQTDTGSLFFLRLFLFFLVLLLGLFPITIVGIVAREIADITLAFEHQQVVYYLVHEIAVVTHHNHASLEVLQVFFQYLKGNDVQIVGRFVEHQEVRITHQDRTKVQTTLFATAELVHIVVLLLRSEEEMLEELRGSQLSATTQLDDFGNVLNHIDDLHLLIELQAFLRIITETDGLANVEGTGIGLVFSHENLDEGGFSGSIVADNTHLFVTGKDVGEIVQNLQVAETLVQMVGFENLRTDIRCLDIQLDIAIVEALLGYFFQFIKGFFAIAGLMSTGLRHTAHPLQFRTIEVVGTDDFCIGGINPFLTLFQVIAIIAFIRINLLVVYLDDFGADSIQEIAVVGDHEQTQCTATQITFQPFGHFQVEVVGRFVQYQEIGFGNQDIRQRYTLQLSTREMLDLLVEIADFQLGKNLLGLAFIVPSLFLFHTGEEVFQSRIPFRLHALFVFLDELDNRSSVIETGFEYGQFFRIVRILFQITHTQIPTIDNLAFVVTFLSAQDTQKGCLSASVLGNQTDALSFGYSEVDLLEQNQIAERLGQSFYL